MDVKLNSLDMSTMSPEVMDKTTILTKMQGNAEQKEKHPPCSVIYNRSFLTYHSSEIVLFRGSQF